MQIRCNFPDISYLSETQKNNFQFLKETIVRLISFIQMTKITQAIEVTYAVG